MKNVIEFLDFYENWVANNNLTFIKKRINIIILTH